ncbi:hypothetical protein [Streptomyces sp. 769]|nr:hypothetical protein [Streptomyces sp. 769]
MEHRTTGELMTRKVVSVRLDRSGRSVVTVEGRAGEGRSSS